MSVIHDMPEAEYRALPGLSGTEVAKLLDNPADLKWDRDHPRESTDAQVLGTMVHSLVLTPDVRMPYAANPYSYKTQRKDWEARKAEILSVGAIPVSKDVMDRAHSIAEAVDECPAAYRLLDAPGDFEVTVTGDHQGAPLKGRIDMLPKSGPVVDLKSAKDVSPRAMSRFIGEYGTATQLAHYALLADRADEPAQIIAVRNQGRPAVAVYQLTEVTWHVALEATKRAWDIYADCVESGVWPDPYAEAINPLEMKPWDLDDLEGGAVIDVEVTL